MATMIITEYERLAQDAAGNTIQAGQEPALNIQEVSYTGTQNSSNVFHKSTTVIRITVDEVTWLKFGNSPTVATTGSNIGSEVQADTPEFFGAAGGLNLSAITA